MNYTGNIYRPPFENQSLLLQVTVGCSHNQCAFCTMYRDVPFRVEPLEQIEADLGEAQQYAPNVTRVFLENGDPFVLSANRLKTIARMVHQKLPQVETISMYASVHNIKLKTDEELRELRALGINELNIGVESGLDEALEQMNKGYTGKEATSELLRLRNAGISYGVNIIFGAAGSERRVENAKKTAELINRTQPHLIFTGTVHADPGCPLHDRLESGAFRENTVEEYLEEEEIFLQSLDVKNCVYFGLHPSNIVGLYDRLPLGKESMLEMIAQKRNTLSRAQLISKPVRYSEGAILL